MQAWAVENLASTSPMLLVRLDFVLTCDFRQLERTRLISACIRRRTKNDSPSTRNWKPTSPPRDEENSALSEEAPILPFESL